VSRRGTRCWGPNAARWSGLGRGFGGGRATVTSWTSRSGGGSGGRAVGARGARESVDDGSAESEDCKLGEHFDGLRWKSRTFEASVKLRGEEDSGRCFA